MTWAELHGVLRGRGLIKADAALQPEAAVGAVRDLVREPQQGSRAAPLDRQVGLADRQRDQVRGEGGGPAGGRLTVAAASLLRARAMVR